jgi:glycosyltransferase involved in cell wall biosynthesis
LLRAFARLLDLRDLHLAVCCSNSPNKAKPYLRLARHLGLGDRLHWEFRLSQAALEPWRRHALVSVAPLSECARNLQQGCAPLKILESMAAGVPVVASDLPAVREILEDGVHGRLVAPDRPAELARALRILLEYPEVRVAMGQQARRHLGDNLAWGHSLDLLDRVYLELGLGGGLDPDRNGTEPKSMDANG